jgi:hypothetical protein
MALGESVSFAAADDGVDLTTPFFWMRHENRRYWGQTESAVDEVEADEVEADYSIHDQNSFADEIQVAVDNIVQEQVAVNGMLMDMVDGEHWGSDDDFFQKKTEDFLRT